jgi:hypothetical protein
MNEAEWLSTSDPEELLDALRASGGCPRLSTSTGGGMS